MYGPTSAAGPVNSHFLASLCPTCLNTVVTYYNLNSKFSSLTSQEFLWVFNMSSLSQKLQSHKRSRGSKTSVWIDETKMELWISFQKTDFEPLNSFQYFFFFFSWRCKLWYIEWINSKVLLNSTGNYIQYLIINHGKGYEKGYIYV